MIRSSVAESEFSRLRIASLVCGSSRSLELMTDCMVAILFFNRCASFSHSKLAKLFFLFKPFCETAIVFPLAQRRSVASATQKMANAYASVAPGLKRNRHKLTEQGSCYTVLAGQSCRQNHGLKCRQANVVPVVSGHTGTASSLWDRSVCPIQAV